MKTNNFFICLLMGLLSAVTVWNTDLLKPTAVNAVPPEVPAYNFVPVGKFNLDLNLETGTATVESNLRVTEANIKVDHPTKVVEKVVYKQSKPITKYEVKTEYLEKTVLFPLPKARLHVPSVSVPTKVTKK